MNPRIRSARPAASRRIASGRGFTILELMVAMTISLFIISALAAVVIGASSTNRTRDRASDLQVNGRYAIEQIRRDLQHAGYLGITSLFAPPDPITVANAPLSPAITVTNVCDAATVGKLSERIWGADDSNPYSATCIPAANYLRGDVLVIRGLNPNAEAGPYSSSLVYYYSSYDGGSPFKGPTVPDFTTTTRKTPYIAYRMDETVYYVAPFTTSATESPAIPALWRLKLGSGPAMVPELVASGVENMQIRYGIFETNDTVQYMKASDIASDHWDLVRSVQVSLLMRGTTVEPEYSNNTTYTLADATYTVSDGYPRLALTAVIQQRN